MLDEYLGLIGLLLVGVGAAFCLYALASRLRKRFAPLSGGRESSAAPRSELQTSQMRPSTSKYFFIAIVGLLLQAGSFYFYLWGASIRKAGLTGLVVMLAFGMCLMMGVFYSWARGGVVSATEGGDPTQAKLVEPTA